MATTSLSPDPTLTVVGLCASPRRDGNSRALVESVLAGAAEAGHETTIVHLADPIEAARQLGRRLGTARSTDFRLTTRRPAAVWGDDRSMAMAVSDQE